MLCEKWVGWRCPMKPSLTRRKLYLLVRSPAEGPLCCEVSEKLLHRLLADISKHTGQLLI